MRPSQLELREGDAEQPISVDELAGDPALSERIFASKHETLLAGMRHRAPTGEASDAHATIAAIQNLPWGDLGPAIQAIGDGFELMMLLTPDMFAIWENELGDRVFVDEFNIPVEQAVQLPIEQRFAHVARLLRSVAMDFGIRTDYGLGAVEAREVMGEIQPNTPAFVLNLLHELSSAEAQRRASRKP